jgi:hypothetical protein
MAVEKQGDKEMRDAATASMASAAVTAPDFAKTPSEPISVILVDEAASTLHELSGRTGIAIETLIATSITLLKIVVESKNLGRKIVLTTKLLWPIREVRIP